MLDYENFMEEVTAEVKKIYDDTYTIRRTKISRNNGIVRDGIIISAEGEAVVPTIYLDTFYEVYKAGMAMQHIVEEICRDYESRKNVQFEDFDITRFTEWEVVKDRVICQLVNEEMNREFLLSHPHVELLDLAIVFLVYVEQREDGQLTVTVNNQHLQMWKVTLEELKEVAERNTRRLQPEKLIRIDELMNQLMKDMIGDAAEALPENILEDTKMMYVLTNERKIRGAVSMCYPGVLKSIAEKLDSDVFVLPSSLHEVILIRKDADTNLETLKEMVHEVNEEQVVLEERLSDHVYLYVKDRDELVIVA